MRQSEFNAVFKQAVTKKDAAGALWSAIENQMKLVDAISDMLRGGWQHVVGLVIELYAPRDTVEVTIQRREDGGWLIRHSGGKVVGAPLRQPAEEISGEEEFNPPVDEKTGDGS